jgi:hypothetical protein
VQKLAFQMNGQNLLGSLLQVKSHGGVHNHMVTRNFIQDLVTKTWCLEHTITVKCVSYSKKLCFSKEYGLFANLTWKCKRKNLNIDILNAVQNTPQKNVLQSSLDSKDKGSYHIGTYEALHQRKKRIPRTRRKGIFLKGSYPEPVLCNEDQTSSH